MATLTVNRLYSDGEVLTEAQLDRIRVDIETFFNDTQVSDENIQNAGLTGSSVLADGSVTSAKLADNAILSAKLVANAVTTAKFADNAVTSEKVAQNAVTLAKTTSLFLPTEEGSIRLFHTYNSTVDVPRGWMICNGSTVNETNYNALHGAGAYATDGIALSNLLTKSLPNFNNRFAIGVSATTQDGSSAITAVGNPGSTIDLSHTHGLATHTHSATTVGYGAGVLSNNRFANSGPTSANSVTLQSSLSSSVSIEPENIDFLFIMRVI